MTIIGVVNASTLLSDHDAGAITVACARQLKQHCAPLWGRKPMLVRFYKKAPAAKAGTDRYIIGIADDSDQAGALGWHTKDGSNVYGRVFVRPVLDNGGTVSTGELSVSAVLSHEVMETFCDSAVNLWADQGPRAIAYEVGDPVEADSYEIDGIAVSNFVLPAWFDPQAGPPYDYLGNLTAPFSMTPGGYFVYRAEGGMKQVFADQVPDWKTPIKLDPLARTLKRLI